VAQNLRITLGLAETRIRNKSMLECTWDRDSSLDGKERGKNVARLDRGQLLRGTAQFTSSTTSISKAPICPRVSDENVAGYSPRPPLMQGTPLKNQESQPRQEIHLRGNVITYVSHFQSLSRPSSPSAWELAAESGLSANKTEQFFAKARGMRLNTIFIGREKELAELHEMLMDKRSRAEGTSAVLLQCLP
jgi:hypothetical protein